MGGANVIAGPLFHVIPNGFNKQTWRQAKNDDLAESAVSNFIL